MQENVRETVARLLTEAAEQFKQGDQVRLTRTVKGRRKTYPKGASGVISGTMGKNAYMVRVKGKGEVELFSSEFEKV